MCLGMQRSAVPEVSAPPDPETAEANAQAALQTKLRRRRAGAAADVLTSPLGIPAGTATRMGDVA